MDRLSIGLGEIGYTVEVVDGRDYSMLSRIP